MVGRILVFLGGLLVVALFLALLAPLFVDWTDFRKNFEDQASRILGKKVSVLGAVDARILPFPSVTLHDVTVGPGLDGQPIVHVARFSMDAELAPFLSGEARIFDMRIEDPQVRMRLLPDGTLDWMRGGKPELPAGMVVLERVHVTGGSVQLIDEQSGRTRKLENLEATMAAGTLAGPWSAEGKAVLDGEGARFHLSTLRSDARRPAVPLRLNILPDQHPVQVDLDGELSVEGGRPIYKGKFQGQIVQNRVAPGSPPKPAGPTVKGDFELANDRIRVPAYRLELGTADNPYAVTGEATLDTGANPQFLLTADGQQIDVNRIEANGAKGKTGRDPAASAKQRLNRLITVAAGIPIPKVPGHARLSLPAIVAGDTVIRDVRLDLRPGDRGWAVDSAQAILPGRTQVEAKGRLNLVGEPSFAGDLLVASTQPSGLASWLSGNVDPAIRDLDAAGFSALVSLTPDLQRFEKLELRIGPDTLKGRVERQSFGADRPTLSLDLTGNSLDLDAMRAMATLVSGQDAGDSLFSHQIGARLKLGSFSAFGTTARDVDTVFTIRDDTYQVEKLNIGDLGGAAIRASGKGSGSLLDASGEGDVNFSAADPGPFLDMLRQHLGPHPALNTLIANAGWYANSALEAHLAIGGTDGSFRVTVGGRMNGSRVSASFAEDGLTDLMSEAHRKLDVALDNPSGSILLGQMGFNPLPLDGDGAARLQLSLEQTGDTPAAAALRFNSGATRAAADGTIALDAARFLNGQAHLSIESSDLEPYLVMNGVVLPQSGLGLPVKLGADLSIDQQHVDVTALDTIVAGNPIKGAIKLARRTDILKGEGALSFGTLDLPWLAEAVAGPVTDGGGALSAEPLPGRPAVNADLSIAATAASLSTGLQTPVRDFSGQLAMQANALGLENIAGNWFGGRLGGRMSLSNNAGTGYLQTRLDLKNGDLSSLLAAQYPGAATASGRFDLSLSAESSGKSLAELLSSANGSGAVDLSGLAVEQLDLGIFGPLLAEIDATQGDVTEAGVTVALAPLLEGGRSAIGSVTVPFNLTAGTLRVQNVVAETPAARLSAEARLTLADLGVDAALSVRLQPGEEALAGADPAFRIVYHGPLASPAKSLDVTELTNFLSLRAFERERRRVETLQANVLEKQRLRREVALYRYEARRREEEARQKAEAEERARAEEEARQRAEAEARAAEEARGAVTASPPDGAAASAAEPPVSQPMPPNPPSVAEPPGPGIAATPRPRAEPRSTQTTPLAAPVPPVRVLPVPPRQRVIRQPIPSPSFDAVPSDR